MTGHTLPAGHDRSVSVPRSPAVSGPVRDRSTEQSYPLTGHPVTLKGVFL